MTRSQPTTDHRSTIACPQCGHRATETMPTDSCLFFYECLGCGTTLKPKAGDCCVFCSYGDHQCPPKTSGEGAPNQMQP